MTIKFSNELKRAINAVSQDVAAEIEDVPGNEEAVTECTLDGDRLSMFGYPEQNKELKSLIEQHGFGAVLDEAKKHVATW